MPRKATTTRAKKTKASLLTKEIDNAIEAPQSPTAKSKAVAEPADKENVLEVLEVDSKLSSRKKIAKERLLKAFDDEVEARSTMMKMEAEKLVVLFKQSLSVWRLQLPERVRSMQLAEFCNTYNGNVNAVMAAEVQANTTALVTPRRSARISKPTSATAQKLRAARSAIRTPINTAKTSMTAATPAQAEVPSTPSMNFLPASSKTETKSATATNDPIAAMLANFMQTATGGVEDKLAFLKEQMKNFEESLKNK